MRSGQAVQTDIRDLVFGDWVKRAEDQASKDGVTGTPTVFVNGEELSNEEISLLLEDGSQLEQVLQSHA